MSKVDFLTVDFDHKSQSWPLTLTYHFLKMLLSLIVIITTLLPYLLPYFKFRNSEFIWLPKPLNFCKDFPPFFVWDFYYYYLVTIRLSYDDKCHIQSSIVRRNMIFKSYLIKCSLFINIFHIFITCINLHSILLLLSSFFQIELRLNNFDT